MFGLGSVLLFDLLPPLHGVGFPGPSHNLLGELFTQLLLDLSRLRAVDRNGTKGKNLQGNKYKGRRGRETGR